MRLVEYHLLLLIIVANGAPILGEALFGKAGAWPIDGGLKFIDGHPLLGNSKTWRGILLAITAATVMAWLLYLPPYIGASVGLFAVLGDLLSSFIKRRLGLVSSSMAFGLDQIPEALLPLLVVKDYFDLTCFAIVEIVAGFIILELLLSRILFYLKIRKRPY
jgi:CDP-2,3-bis-(O-geranylgeranyl)-sn-glycerol synthase